MFLNIIRTQNKAMLYKFSGFILEQLQNIFSKAKIYVAVLELS